MILFQFRMEVFDEDFDGWVQRREEDAALPDAEKLRVRLVPMGLEHSIASASTLEALQP